MPGGRANSSAAAGLETDMTYALPSVLTALLAGNQWGNWSVPEKRKLHLGIVAMLRDHIPRAKDALQPSGQPLRIAQGLMRLAAPFQGKTADTPQTWETRIGSYSKTLAMYPEDLVYAAINDLAKAPAWPQLAEFVAAVDTKIKARRVELERMQECLRVATAKDDKPPPMSDEERQQMLGNLARLNNWMGQVNCARARNLGAPWEGPWPLASDLYSDAAYDAYLALPNVQAALGREMALPQEPLPPRPTDQPGAM